MNPIVKVVIAATISCLILYFGVSSFLGKTTELEESLDVKSLSYIRQDNETAKARPERDGEANSVQSEKTVDRVSDASNAGSGSSPADADAPVRAPADSLSAARLKTAAAEVTEVKSLDASSEKPSTATSRLKETLGITEPSPPVRAVDVVFEVPRNCDASEIVLAPLSVKYRYDSPSIKGVSISELQLFVAEYEHCNGGVFRFSHNPLGKQDGTPMLMQRRLDELKYFFLQHSVPKSALKFPNS